jgi:hypothetical protein
VIPVRAIKGYVTVPPVAVLATATPAFEYEMVFAVTAVTVYWPSKRASAGLKATAMVYPTAAECAATVIVAVVVVADLLVTVPTV